MSRPAIAPPVLNTTRYDRAVAMVIATVLCLGTICFAVSVLWYTNRAPATVKSVPVELIELPGGFEDGVVDETLRVDSPDPERADASPADEVSDELEIAESLESTTELSDVATEPAQKQFETGLKNTGKKGSASGTGRRALGSGGGKSGISREQRWFVKFGDDADLNQYARQLDFFQIELAALLPGGELVYLSQMSKGQPVIRRVQTGQGEGRLHMTWQGGQRRFADAQLFAQAGVPLPPETTTFHFYPPEVEAQLARLEFDYRSRPVNQIKRTYFSVISQGNGYRFEVSRQLYFN